MVFIVERIMIMSAIPSSNFSRGSYLTLMALTAVLVAGCSTPASQPILYPNTKYQTVGEAEAHADIDQCMQMATSAGVKTTADGRILEKSASSAAVGAASAGAWGGAILENTCLPERLREQRAAQFEGYSLQTEPILCLETSRKNAYVTKATISSAGNKVIAKV
jgi:hypothetical protein